MNTNRNGKIARLPRTIRDELNHRIDDGTPGPQLLAWLNAEPVVKEILAEYFGGRPITKQNLSEWRNGGYQDWFKLQETRDLTLQLAEQPDALDLDIRPQKITNAFATIAAANFVQASRERLRNCTNIEQEWKCVCDTQRELSRLRHDDYYADSLALRQERWDYQLAAGKPAGAPVAGAFKQPQNHEKRPEVQAGPAKSM